MSSLTEATAVSTGHPARFEFLYLVPVCLVAMLGGLLFGYDTGIISGAIEPLTVRFALTSALKGWVSGCVLLGAAAGVLLAGPLADRWGRRPALFCAAVTFVVSSLGTALPPDLSTFIIFRMLGGIGIGIASISTPMYLAEIVPAPYRGRVVAANQIMIALGITASAVANYAIAHSAGDVASAGAQAWLAEMGWRWMFATGIAPALLFALLLFAVPESPRWLIRHHRWAEAGRILQRIGGDGYRATESAQIATPDAGEASWSMLFSRRLRRPLLTGLALAVLQQITGINVFMYFGATLFRRMSSASGLDAGLFQQIVINGVCTLFTVIAISSVDRWGRRPLMFLGAAGMAVSLFSMGLMAQFMADPAAASAWMLGLIVLYIGCFGLSVGPVVWVVLAEIYPTAVRGRALGIAASALWLADYAVTQTFPLLDSDGSWLVRQFHHGFPFYLYAACCGLLILLVWRHVPETKGRTLEEIEAAWSRARGTR